MFDSDFPRRIANSAKIGVLASMMAVLGGLFLVSGVGVRAATASESVPACEPTPEDALGPFYEPGAPLRDRVGKGYVIQGTVRSAADCAPISGASLEFWLAGPGGEYGDEYRATVKAREDGTFRFESEMPPPYWQRPPHIHIRVTSAGFHTLVTQHYPKAGLSEARFDLVLLPESR